MDWTTMKAAPSIVSLEVWDNFVLVVKFEGLPVKKIDMQKFTLLGPFAQRLRYDINYLRSFKIVDGIPEWEGMALLGPEDLLWAAQAIEQ